MAVMTKVLGDAHNGTSHDPTVAGWQVNPQLNRIMRRGRQIPLSPRSMAVLMELVNSRGAVITKQRLMDRVWRERIVGEGSLTQCIFELRRAFGDSARKSTVIETVHRRGFRLVARVSHANTDWLKVPLTTVRHCISLLVNARPINGNAQSTQQ